MTSYNDAPYILQLFTYRIMKHVLLIKLFQTQYIALKRSRMDNSAPTHPSEYLTGVLYHVIQNTQETPISYKIPAALNELVSLKRSQEALEEHQIKEQVTSRIVK